MNIRSHIYFQINVRLGPVVKSMLEEPWPAEAFEPEALAARLPKVQHAPALIKVLPYLLLSRPSSSSHSLQRQGLWLGQTTGSLAAVCILMRLPAAELARKPPVSRLTRMHHGDLPGQLGQKGWQDGQACCCIALCLPTLKTLGRARIPVSTCLHLAAANKAATQPQLSLLGGCNGGSMQADCSHHGVHFQC